MSSINLSDDLLNNFEETIKNFVAFLLQDPCTGSSTAVASISSSEQHVNSAEQHMRRIHEAANEIECNLLQLKALVHRTLPEEQVLESITDLRTNIERKETLLREFNQYLNDAIADFSVENTESLNGLLDELSRGNTATSGLTGSDLGDGSSQTVTNTQNCTWWRSRIQSEWRIWRWSLLYFSSSASQSNNVRFVTRFSTILSHLIRENHCVTLSSFPDCKTDRTFIRCQTRK